MASVASIYARAFVDVVFQSRLDPDRAIAELQSIVSLLQENADLRRVWENPAIPVQQKHGLLDAIAQSEGISRPVRNLVAVIIDHQRMRFLERIIRQLEKELDQRMGFAEAEVVSARDLGEPEKRVLESQVAKLTGKKVRAQYARNPALLGGAVVRIGSTIYDGSVLGQLERIREQITAG
ncbi:MAG TPA: ATP synthase F1 subunit delta [Candidatus Sulfotelmatobacter sp.]